MRVLRVLLERQFVSELNLSSVNLRQFVSIVKNPATGWFGVVYPESVRFVASICLIQSA